MPRLIDANKLIGDLHNHAFLEGDDREIAYSVIQKQPTIGGWISVKDKLPDKSGTYLCYQPKAASICALNTYRWSTVKGWMGHEVGSRIEGIEWYMPLPEPPKEDK